MRGKTNSLTISGGSTENTLKKLLDKTKSTYYLFYNYGGEYVNDVITYDDTENVITMKCMFLSCRQLVSIPLLNTSNVTEMNNMFQYCTTITTIPLLNTSKVTNMEYMFRYCYKLTEVPALDVSKATNLFLMFQSCTNLSSILMVGAKVSFNIDDSTKFTTEALHTIIDNLGTPSSTQTLTMGSTNLAKVSEEYVTIATNKGWTLA